MTLAATFTGYFTFMKITWWENLAWRKYCCNSRRKTRLRLPPPRIRREGSTGPIERPRQRPIHRYYSGFG
jgi:hypothetical protein